MPLMKLQPRNKLKMPPSDAANIRSVYNTGYQLLWLTAKVTLWNM